MRHFHEFSSSSPSNSNSHFAEQNGNDGRLLRAGFQLLPCLFGKGLLLVVLEVALEPSGLGE